MLATIQFGGTEGTCQAAPSALTATAASSSQINLSWSAVTPPQNCSVTYNVYASTNASFLPSGSNRIATGLVATSFSNAGLQPSTTYDYIVRAADAFGESGK